MAVAERIEVILDLNDRGFSVKMKGNAAELEKFGRGLNALDQRVKKAERSLHGFVPSLRDWTLIIGQARNALHQLWLVFGEGPRRIIAANAEIERMTLLMEGMSEASTQAAREMEAAMNVDTLFDMAKRAPFSIKSIQDSFVKFKAVGIDPLNGSMQSLIDATAAFGGTDETLHRASIAIQQMAGKGVISMEELRQQLGEAVPQAITIMARQLGVTYGELVDKISKGQVEAQGALEAMFRGFEVNFGGRAEKVMEGFNGQMARFRTNMLELFTQNEGMERFFETVKGYLTDINDLAESGALDGYITGLGDAFAWAVDGIVSLTTFVSNLLSEGRALMSILGADRAIGGMFRAFMDWATSALATIREISLAIHEALGTGVSETSIMQERLANGSFIPVDQINEATEAYRQAGEERRKLLEQQRQLEAELAKVGDFDENSLLLLEGADPSGLDEEFKRQIEAWRENGARDADDLRQEIEAVKQAIAEASDEFERMGDTLSDVEKRAANGAFNDLVDTGEISAALNDVRKEYNDAYDEIVENGKLTAQEKMEAMVEAEKQYAANAIAIYEQQRDAAIANINITGEAGYLVADQIKAYFDQKIEETRARLNDVLVDVTGRAGKIPTVSTKKPGGRGGGGKSDAEKAADKIKKLRDDLADDMADIQRKLADPFGFEVPKAIAKTEEKLRDIVRILKPGADLAGNMTAEMKELLNTARQIALGETFLDLQKEARDAERALMGDRGRRNAEAQDQIDYLNDLKGYFTEFGMWRTEHEQVLQNRILQIQEEARRQSPMGDFLSQWKDFGDQMEDIAVEGIDGLAQALADLATEGEMSLERLGRALVNNLIKTGLMNGMSALGDWMSGGFSGRSGVSGGGFWAGVGSFFKKIVGVNHTGAVVGSGEGSSRSIDPSVFLNAPRFHTGGIVGDEVPTILKKKEGVFTPAQMKALGGLARSPANIGINVINNSGVPMDVEQRETRFDGEKMVLDVVLKAASQPGTFRDNLKGALK